MSEDLTGAVTFTNTYSASSDLELKAQKSMKVEAEQLGTFEFELKDADGKVIETVKNDEKVRSASASFPIQRKMLVRPLPTP